MNNNIFFLFITGAGYHSETKTDIYKQICKETCKAVCVTIVY